MIESLGALSVRIQHPRDTVDALNRRAHGREERAIVHVDVRDLMVGDGENLARATIHQLPPEFVFDRDPAARAKYAIERNRALHRGDPIFRKHDGADAALRIKIDQAARHAVDRAIVGRQARIVGSETLEIVVEVRQVNE